MADPQIRAKMSKTRSRALIAMRAYAEELKQKPKKSPKIIKFSNDRETNSKFSIDKWVEPATFVQFTSDRSKLYEAQCPD